MDKNYHSENGKKGAAINREKAIQRYYENPAYCKYCGKIIEVRENEMPSITKRRVFCSSDCHSKFQSEKMMENSIRKSEPLYCLNCGKQLKKSSKKYCSSNCKNEFLYNKYITDWKNGLTDGLIGEYQLSTYIKRYIKEKYDNKCSECGWNKVNPITGHSPLEVHHIDGDYKNNSENNLALLCPNCHSLTENYKALNKNGRKERLK